MKTQKELINDMIRKEYEKTHGKINERINTTNRIKDEFMYMKSVERVEFLIDNYNSLDEIMSDLKILKNEKMEMLDKIGHVHMGSLDAINHQSEGYGDIDDAMYSFESVDELIIDYKNKVRKLDMLSYMACHLGYKNINDLLKYNKIEYRDDTKVHYTPEELKEIEICVHRGYNEKQGEIDDLNKQ